jgi:predicted nucleic acid-binding protein
VNLFVDTNVLVAAADEDHLHHERAFRRLNGADRSRLHCAAHTLAEFYAVATRLPGKPPLSPEQCLLMVESFASQMTTVTLTASEYLATIRRAADAGLSGGLVYDALLLACARKCKADVIYTFNERHFARIAPDLAGRIQAP